jgi:hypothetical protein
VELLEYREDVAAVERPRDELMAVTGGNSFARDDAKVSSDT